jgi:hypothetical protein
MIGFTGTYVAGTPTRPPRETLLVSVVEFETSRGRDTATAVGLTKENVTL